MNTRKANPILLFVLIAASLVLQACGTATTAAPTETMVPTAAPTETTLPSPTPTREPTATQAPTLTPTSAAPAQRSGLPSLGSADETLVALQAGVPDLGEGADSKDFYDPSGLDTLNYIISIQDSSESYVWRTGWCAAEKTELKAIASSIKISLSVNGQEIDLSKSHSGEYSSGQKVCFGFFLVMSDWPDGVTIVEDSIRVVKEFTQNNYTYFQGLELVNRYVVSKEIASGGLLTGGSDGFAFQYSPLLMSNIQEEQVEAHGGMNPFPAYRLYSINGYPVREKVAGTARIYRFSASEYARMNPAVTHMLEIIENLKTGQLPAEAANGVKYGPPGIPQPPVIAGEQNFYVNFHAVKFEGGSGYAFLTQYTNPQNGEMSRMVEVFVGLGGKDTLIVGVFPMYSGTSIQQDISGLKSQDFTPTWDEVDSLLTSIKVTE